MARCQNVFLSPLVSLDIFLVELARTEVSSKETVASIYHCTKDQPSKSRAMCDQYPLVKKKNHACVGVHRVTDLEQFPVWISKDEASFDCYLSGRCARKTMTLWSAALRIPRPHIHVSFSLWLWTNWWWKRASFAFRLSGLFVTSETSVTDLAGSSRLKLADEIWPDRHAFLPS